MEANWEALFTEMDNFLISLERNKENAEKRFVEYALERLEMCIICVARIIDHLNSSASDLTDPQEYSILEMYSSHFEQLVQHLRLIVIEWQQYLDNCQVHEVRYAYSTPYTSLVHASGQGRPKFDITKEQLEYLNSMSFNWSQVARLLGVSRTTVYRRRIELGVTTDRLVTNVTDDQLIDIIRDIKRNYPSLGESLLRGMLISMGVHASRGRIRSCIRALDPINTTLRWRGEMARRQPYSVPGPNSLWHIDGHHKLIRWRLVTHGAIDGASRLIVLLKTSSNNRSTTVYDEFLRAVREYGLPSRIRTDQGRENILVAHHMLRHRGINRRSALVGSSVHNQRIERLWRDFHRCVTQLFYRLFYFLEQHGYLNPVEDKCLYALHYVFLPRINKAVKLFAEAWNNHGVRTEKYMSPNQLFTSGMLQLQNSGLEAMDIFDTPSEDYGVEEEGLVSIPEESNVNIPRNCIQLSDEQFYSLQSTVDPLVECEDYGINLYMTTLQFLGSLGF